MSIRDKPQYGTKQGRNYEFYIETAASFPLTHFPICRGPE